MNAKECFVGADQLPEQVHLIEDEERGFSGTTIIHSTALGPAAGGCRLWHYDSPAELTADAFRLARTMSYKNALAGLPFGGGVTVLQRPQRDFDRAALFALVGDHVERLDGAYLTLPDVGSDAHDMAVLRTRTRHVAGQAAAPGRIASNPALWTARGVFESIRAAVAVRMGRRSLDGLVVAVQGAGNVGAELCRLLAAEDATILVADMDVSRARAVAAETGARVFPAAAILEADCDVFAPCALGGVLNRNSIARLRARVVAGAANNQLASAEDAALLHARDILYAPDLVANAGGMIHLATDHLKEGRSQTEARLRAIPERLRAIFAEAQLRGTGTHAVAEDMARAVISAAQPKRLLMQAA